MTNLNGSHINRWQRQQYLSARARQMAAAGVAVGGYLQIMNVYSPDTTPLWRVFNSIVTATHWYSNTIPIA